MQNQIFFAISIKFKCANKLFAHQENNGFANINHKFDFYFLTYLSTTATKHTARAGSAGSDLSTSQFPPLHTRSGLGKRSKLNKWRKREKKESNN